MVIHKRHSRAFNFRLLIQLKRVHLPDTTDFSKH